MSQVMISMPIADELAEGQGLGAAHVQTAMNGDYFACVCLVISQMGVRPFPSEPILRDRLAAMKDEGIPQGRLDTVRATNRAHTPTVYFVGTDIEQDEEQVAEHHHRAAQQRLPVQYISLEDVLDIAGCCGWDELRAWMLESPQNMLEAAVGADVLLVHDGDRWMYEELTHEDVRLLLEGA